MTHTDIVESTGTDAANVSTASDMLLLGAIAAADPTMSELTSRGKTLAADRTATFTTNLLLGSNGITGLKTGNVGEGTYAFLYTATVPSRLPEPFSVTGVMLGGESSKHTFNAVTATFDSLQDNARVEPLLAAGTQVGALTTPWGASAKIVTAGKAEIIVWGAPAVEVALDIRDPDEFTDGAVVGELTWTAGPQTESVDVVIEGDIGPASAVWRLTHPAELAAG